MPGNEIIEQSKIIFSCIKDDIENLKDINPEELDFSDHFESLKPVMCFFIDNRTRFRNNDISKKLLLAYSLEIAKKPGSSFWDAFFSELDRENEQTVYKFVFDSIWECLTFLDCHPYKNYNGRQLVTTLFRLTDADPELLNNILDFFTFYYKNFKGQSIGTSLSNFPPCQKYLYNKERRDSIIHSIELLTKAIDEILEKYPDQLEDEEFLKILIRKEYGIRGSWFSRKKITTIIKELINTITPPQFLRILKNNRESYVIHPEKGTVSARLLESQIIDYGKYVINTDTFTVTPHFKISINDMKNWASEDIREFKGFTYYKKSKLFEVSLPPVRKLCDGEVRFYVWCRNLPVGQEVKIDDKRKRREGLWWNPQLKVQLIDFQTTPFLAIEFGNIIGYYPESANKEFILVCGSQSKKKIINFQGIITVENPRFLLIGDETDIQVSCKVDGSEKKLSQIKFNDHMLFSSSSREQIKNLIDFSKTVKRQFGEYRYYLFSTIKTDEIREFEQKNIKINALNKTLGKYNIFEVLWENPGQFTLKIEDYIWVFETQKYIQIQFFNNNNIFESISNMQIYLESNLQDINEKLHCKILNCNYEQITNPIDIDTDHFSKNKFILPGSTILESLEGDLVPGEYILEVQCGELVTQRSFFIVPHVDVKWPDLLVEGERSTVEISSSAPYLRNIQNNEGTNKLSIEIVGHVIEYRKEERKIRPDTEFQQIKFSYVEPPQTAEKTPETPLYVFGYRLYRQFIEDSKIYLSSLSELNYYDLHESQLLVFSKPNDPFEISINDVNVLSSIFDHEGQFLQKNLAEFKKYCQYPQTVLKITTQNFVKKFIIIWNPKIISLKSPKELLEREFSADLEFEGPEGSFVTVELKTPIATLTSQKFDCHGIQERIILNFTVDKGDNSFFFYVISSISSENGLLLPSRTNTISNNQSFYIQTRILNDKKIELKIPMEKFQEEINQYISKIVVYPDPIIVSTFAKSLNTAILRNLVKIINENAPQALFIFFEEKKRNLENFPKINENRVYLKDLLDLNKEFSQKLLSDIFNPVKFEDIIKKGIGVSSKEILNDIEFYLPKPNPIIFIESQLMKPSQKEKIIQLYPYRTIIFLERGAS
jgi:hypothetical protein